MNQSLWDWGYYRDWASLVAQKVSARDAGDPGLILGLGRSPGEGNPLQAQFSSSFFFQAQFSSLEDGEGKSSGGALCLKTDYLQSEEKQHYMKGDQFPGTYHGPFCGGWNLTKREIVKFPG